MKTYTGILEQLTAFKASLLQIVEYTDPFGKLHCVVIFDKDPQDLVPGMKPVRNWCVRNKLPFPLVVDREFIESSQDSYPLELLSFSHHYRNIYNAVDLLAGLKLQKADVRLQMERELKSKWLLTRMALLEHSLSETRTAGLIRMSVSSLLPVFKGFLFLSGTGIAQELGSLMEQTQKVTGMDLSLIRTLSNSKKTDLQTATQYLGTISALLKFLDEGKL